MSERNADEHALPELRFVALNALVPHEQHDPMRLVTLVSRIREQGRLRNPPVVAPLPGGGERRYVVLDGANRAHAVGASGFPHVVVQVVPYTDPPVRLTTWCHALGDTSRDHFENALHSVAGLLSGSGLVTTRPTWRSPTAPPTRSMAAAACASGTPCSTRWSTPTAGASASSA